MLLSWLLLFDISKVKQDVIQSNYFKIFFIYFVLRYVLLYLSHEKDRHLLYTAGP
jgi:hypothetical protein